LERSQNANLELDLGFLGVQNYLKRLLFRIKVAKTQANQEQKRELSRSRIRIENINREIKIFRICKKTMQHKQKKHNLFWNLIAGFVNFKPQN